MVTLYIITVKRSDENFVSCLECFDLFLAQNMKSWTGALSEGGRIPKLLNDLAREMGDECRPACGRNMISNEKIESICEYHPWGCHHAPRVKQSSTLQNFRIAHDLTLVLHFSHIPRCFRHRQRFQGGQSKAILQSRQEIFCQTS